MITMAIDGATKSSGVAIFDDNKLIHYQCIQATDSSVYNRISKMANQIKTLCEKYNPTDIIIQEVLPEDVKHNQVVYKALIYLQAELVLTLYKKWPNINFCTASHWRAQVGMKTGRGIKRENLKKASIELVKNTFNMQVNDDVSDAICIGMAYIKQNRSAF